VSKKRGKFESWSAVARHTSRCKENSHELIITNNYGPLSANDITNVVDLRELYAKYPELQHNYSDYIKYFKSYGVIHKEYKCKRVAYSKEELINYINLFVSINNKVPQARDFKGTIPNYGNFETEFGTWNKGIEAAGYIPNTQNGYGIDTYGLDKHFYRSKAEARFADKFLFEQYEYEVEPKYPKPHTKWYDWYIPSLYLYIELDGGIRPKVTTEKIEINKKLNRTCLFIQISDIFKKDSLLEFINERFDVAKSHSKP
jgi:hypothetical protein